MEKILDLDKNVAELCAQYPELKQIMVELGFKEITKPLALNTMGRIMTIPKGSALKEIPMNTILDALQQNGFSVIHIPGETKLIEQQLEDAVPSTQLNEKELLLKSYIKRLTEGEDIEIVREEFKKNFSDVSAVEIARAEQTLIKEGTALEDVQRLCDVHSALFHGATNAERIAEAEKEVEKSAKQEQMKQVTSGFDQKIAEDTAQMMNETGHPLQVLAFENQEITRLLDQIEDALAEGRSIPQLLVELRKLTTIAQHYGKKDELLFPLLKDQYGYTGPSDVMWGVEDEIRENLRQILSEPDAPSQEEALKVVLKRVREMVYKEENILFPLCVSCFREDEWIAIAKDFPMFGPCMIPDIPVWSKLKKEETHMEMASDRISLPGGNFNLAQLRAMLNTLPMEITLIDENEINCFFNEGEKIFTRPTMAIGRPVYSCHPKRVEPMVRMLIHDFKKGKRNSMHIISEKFGKQVLINYYALRDENGQYLGTMEAVQKLDGIADAVKNGKKGPVEI